jgi:hypothetical protein
MPAPPMGGAALIAYGQSCIGVVLTDKSDIPRLHSNNVEKNAAIQHPANLVKTAVCASQPAPLCWHKLNQQSSKEPIGEI